MIPGLMCQGGDITGHNGTDHKSIISGEKYGDENFTPKHRGPGILSWQMLDPTQMLPRFSSALPRRSGWMASNVVFSHQVKDGMDVKVAMENFGPGMARPERRSPLLTVDKSSKFDLCFMFTTSLSFL
ncbi:peptidyl-prolyl cis-trans isomerase A-like [Artibeus jamaicensis]|uniref:peptidyl-prolyl cis-trans isomerase A-like n=1 Tax=Artibeus jamaicensis TaxID=9417 RepID=UPI00235A5887|nr:peptidyl-prolyl cis-trans isomerase A-like [Artibeus jamaicensis]